MNRINKEILKLAGPNIISNISIPLISSVDTALMGHLSIAHLGAVGLGSMIFNFIYWNFGFLRMGTTGVTAQAYGSENKGLIHSTLLRSLTIGFVIAMALMLLQWPLHSWASSLMNVPEDQVGLVKTYFDIRIWAAPATLALYVFMGWFFGMQNAIYPLIITILINLLNVIISSYFVVGLGWEVAGVAWGTVISQYLGLLSCMVLMIYKYPEFLAFGQLKILSQIDQYAALLKINGNIFLRTLCLTFVFAFFYSQSAAADPMVLATNVILLQFLHWMSFGIDGFAYASESLVGKYYGARDKNMLHTTIRYSFLWAGVLAIFYSAIYYLFDEPLIGLFTKDPATAAQTSLSIIWIVLLPIASFAAYIWDGVYIGLTASRQMRDTMLISLSAYLILYFLLESLPPITRIWLSLLIFMAVRGIVQSIWYVTFIAPKNRF